ncbi:MAG: SRPBCC family protein [Mycobacteriaceae bacterium]|nr:SRPBCC family protein [Mycobacteriaceae bacterium]
MTATRDIDAPRRRVWEVLADGWTYSQWVVGNSRMRAVDANWPAPGTIIKHSIGAWPLVIDDETVSLECNPERELVLLAKVGPVGAARVTLRLTDIENGCRVEMSEVPEQGPMSIIPDRIAEPVADVRNRECLWRLENLSKHRDPAELEN